MRTCMAFAIGLAALAGCGSAKNLPVACEGGTPAVLKALANAPGAVELGKTPISHCFVLGASSDAVQILGTYLLGAAQQLGDKARAGDSKAALELGYLIGAAQRGARKSEIGDEMIRRLEAETTVGAARQAAYNRGLAAGLADG